VFLLGGFDDGYKVFLGVGFQVLLMSLFLSWLGDPVYLGAGVFLLCSCRFWRIGLACAGLVFVVFGPLFVAAAVYICNDCFNIGFCYVFEINSVLAQNNFP